jgi:ubiquinone/menaquinone biosynthesis C-methylase UbiE
MSTTDHFNSIAYDYDRYKEKNRYYYNNLKKLLKSHIQPRKRVLEIGCGTGELLVSLDPSLGCGIDISSEMVKIAKDKYKKYKNIRFSTKPVRSYKDDKLDYIFMSDVIEHLDNPNDLFKQISMVMDKETVFLSTWANPLWEPVLLVAEKLRLKMPEGKHKRWKFRKIKSMINSSGLKIIKHDFHLLIPIKIPMVTNILNKHIEPFFKQLCFIEYVVAKKTS